MAYAEADQVDPELKRFIEDFVRERLAGYALPRDINVVAKPDFDGDPAIYVDVQHGSEGSFDDPKRQR